MPETDDQQLTIAQVGDALHASRWSIYRLIESKELPAANIAPAGHRAQWRIPRSALAAFIARRTVPATNQD